MPATWASTPGTFCTVAERTCRIGGNSPKKWRIIDDIQAGGEPQRARKVAFKWPNLRMRGASSAAKCRLGRDTDTAANGSVKTAAVGRWWVMAAGRRRD